SHPLIRSYLIVQKIPDPTGVTRTPEWPALDRHLDGVRDFARRICESLKLPEDLTLPIELAAAWHDLGKGRAVWQRGAGNARTNAPVSKTVHGRPPEHLNHYRHELGSLMDLHRESEQHTQLASLNDLQRDLVLHLIGAHHGRARPNFPAHEIIDPDSATAPLGPVCDEVPERFARLQQKFGRWGLAYLESVLRAADALDSKRIDASPIGNPLPGEWKPSLSTPFVVPVKPALQPTATIHVDPCNPGQFLACCGLLEFADRQWPGASGWFEANQFHIHAAGNLKQLLDAFASCTLTNTMTSADHARLEELRKKSNERKKDSSLEEEFKRLEQQVRENPLLLQSRLPLRLDWFTDDAAGGSRFKTWAGQQSVLRIAEAMKASLKGEEWRNETCLSHSVSGCGLPFNFDSDLGSQGGAIDVGFSFDPLAGSALTRIETSARPVLELFAFIGLQRFRPSQIKNENRYQYAAWKRPLPVGIAFAAASGALPVADGDCFEFRLLYRTKYLKSFLPAVPLYGASHE
ncbi:type I-G CRISPR-associated protein Cas8g2, partial [Schlesneria sp.]|uniref:type I-G CRISPR-associated protein Cas8g2 n=1 Tax=Schlesneria sp. TaxID=2762018 RepID=UPI002EDD37E5